MIQDYHFDPNHTIAVVHKNQKELVVVVGEIGYYYYYLLRYNLMTNYFLLDNLHC